MMERVGEPVYFKYVAVDPSPAALPALLIKGLTVYPIEFEIFCEENISRKEFYPIMFEKLQECISRLVQEEKSKRKSPLVIKNIYITFRAYDPYFPNSFTRENTQQGIGWKGRYSITFETEELKDEPEKPNKKSEAFVRTVLDKV